MAGNATQYRNSDRHAVQRQVRLFRGRRSKLAVRLAACAFATGVFAYATPASAQTDDDTATVGESFLAPRQFMGVAREGGAIVRGGPSSGELAVATLPAGAEVVVIARQDDFLRILPPEDAFCLVPKSRVNVRGTIGEGAQTGRVSDGLSVRVGSLLSEGIGSTAQRLRAGDIVRVVGEQGNHYRIEPPKMVFFYVPITEMGKGREVRVTETPTGWNVSELPKEAVPAIAETTVEPEPQAVVADEPEVEAEPEIVIDDTPEVAIDDQPMDVELPEEPTVVIEPPAIATSEVMARFEAIDARYKEVAELPLHEQPLAELEADYAELIALAGEAGDPASLNLVPLLEARLRTVTIRREALADLEEIRRMRAGVDDRRTALEAERAELAERVEMGRVTVYEAVGELQTSSLQTRGGDTLFRLVDPISKRTVIYVRASGDEAVALAGRITKFVGVRGTVSTDDVMKLKYVQVKASDLVNPDDVFGSVASKLIPPSMVRPDLTEPAVVSAQ